MKSNINLISMISALVAGAVGVISIILIFLQDSDSDAALAGPVDTALLVTMIIFGLTVVVALLSAVAGMAVNPAGIKNAVIGIGTLGVILLVAWLLSKPGDMTNVEITESTAKMVSWGLNTFYILGLLAIVTVLYSGVARILK